MKPKYKHWKTEEIELLKGSSTASELSILLGRSVQTINSKRRWVARGETSGRRISQLLVLENGRRPCSRCGVEKPLSEFHSCTNLVSGVNPACKVCENERRRKWRNEHADQIKTRQPHYRRTYKSRHPERQRASERRQSLKKKFGISIEQYDKMLELQAFGCAICRAVSDKSGRRLAVDHDHKTGRLRGLLCTNCNTAVGLLDESPHIFELALEYVKNA